jgi:hypothetical protein
MEQNQIEEEVITDVALSEQDKSTVAILQKDDLENLKAAVEKVKTFKRKYSLKKIEVTDIESKEQQEKLRLALQEMRTTRTALSKDKTDKTKPYRDTVSYINSNYEKVISEIERIEEPAKNHKKELEEKIEAKAKEAELAKQKRVNDRVNSLLSSGVVFDGEFYSIGSEEFGVDPISLGIADLEITTDAIFENILVQVKSKAAAIAEATEAKEARLFMEKQQKEAAEAEERRVFKEDQDRLQKEKDDLAAEMEVFRKQKAELEAEKDRVAKEKLAEQVRLSNEAAAKDKKRINDRCAQLVSLGMKFNGQHGCYAFEDVNVDNATEICLFDDTEWNDLIDKITPAIAERKQVAEQKAIEAKIIADKAIADKAIEDKKKQDEADELARKNELAKKGDEAVWNDFASRLNAISYPEMKTEFFKIKVEEVQKFISSLFISSL